MYLIRTDYSQLKLAFGWRLCLSEGQPSCLLWATDVLLHIQEVESNEVIYRLWTVSLLTR